MHSLSALPRRRLLRALLHPQCRCPTSAALLISSPSPSTPSLPSSLPFHSSSVRHSRTNIIPRSNADAVYSLGERSHMPTLKRENEKTPMEFIAEVAPIVVDATTAVCDGGGGALGHPIEYIQLNKINVNEPETCKYCGLRFIQKHKEHAGNKH
jgi:NADH dehydrogenase (ubiquinone) Fe-S protein 6